MKVDVGTLGYPRTAVLRQRDTGTVEELSVLAAGEHSSLQPRSREILVDVSDRNSVDRIQAWKLFSDPGIIDLQLVLGVAEVREKEENVMTGRMEKHEVSLQVRIEGLTRLVVEGIAAWWAD